MKVIAQHPCPVRWRTPRGRAQVSYLALRTPIEIPEADAGTLGREIVAFTLNGLERRLPLHAGRLWCPAHVRAHYAPVRAETDAFALAEHLAARSGVPSGVAIPGSPLCGSKLGDDETGQHGAELPDGALAGAETDHVDAVRESLRRWAATDLLIVDGNAFAAVGVPALLPFRTDWGHNVVEQAPSDLSLGLAVEPARIRPMRRAYASLRFREPTEPARNTLQSHAFENAFKHLPDTRRDLATFANAGPREVMEALNRAAPHIEGTDGSRDILLRHVESLAPYADLGLVGAIGEDRHHEAVSLSIAALDALKALSPRGYSPVRTRRLYAFAACVARPAMRSAPIPSEDIDDIAALAP